MWSHAPHPIQNIPSIWELLSLSSQTMRQVSEGQDVSQNPDVQRELFRVMTEGPTKQEARRVLLDFYHDSNTRGYLMNYASPKKYFNAGEREPGTPFEPNVEDNDPMTLIHGYEHGVIFITDSETGKKKRFLVPHWKDQFIPAVTHAVLNRITAGPLPDSHYETDPVLVYYYDENVCKVIAYPYASITSNPGGALDPSNKQWWKLGGVYVRNTGATRPYASVVHNASGRAYVDTPDPSWGDEGFDWNKDVVGNVAQILGTICSIIGAILQLVPGIGTAVGTAFIVASTVIVAALGVVDAAFAGGDIENALLHLVKVIATDIANLAGAGQAVDTVISVTMSVIKDVVPHVQNMGPEPGDMMRAYNSAIADAPNISRVSPDVIDTIGKYLHSPQADKILHHGYDVSNYADMTTIIFMSLLFDNPGAGNLFAFGAMLGFVEKMQKATPEQNNRAMMAFEMGRGLSIVQSLGIGQSRYALANSSAGALARIRSSSSPLAGILSVIESPAPAPRLAPAAGPRLPPSAPTPLVTPKASLPGIIIPRPAPPLVISRPAWVDVLVDLPKRNT